MLNNYTVQGLPADVTKIIALSDLSRYTEEDVLLVQINSMSPQRAMNTAENLSSIIKQHTKAKVIAIFHQVNLVEFVHSNKMEQLLHD